jgi:hypothetical protein
LTGLKKNEVNRSEKNENYWMATEKIVKETIFLTASECRCVCKGRMGSTRLMLPARPCLRPSGTTRRPRGHFRGAFQSDILCRGWLKTVFIGFSRHNVFPALRNLRWSVKKKHQEALSRELAKRETRKETGFFYDTLLINKKKRESTCKGLYQKWFVL